VDLSALNATVFPGSADVGPKNNLVY